MELTNEYKAAIQKAITAYDGKFDSITTARVVAINKSIVDGLNARIDSVGHHVAANRKDIDSIFVTLTDLVSKVNALRGDVDALLATVQSITIIPDYSDGSVSLLKLTPKENKYRFEIYPESTAQKLVEAGTGVFSMKAVYTMTKAVGSSVNMPVTAATYKDGIVEITADASSINSEVYYCKNGISANARLMISSGNTRKASDYFLLTPTVPGAVDLGLSVWWAVNDLGTTSTALDNDDNDNVYQWGSLEVYSGASFAVPRLDCIQGTEYDAATQTLGATWCIPTEDEFEELIEECKIETQHQMLILTGPSGKSIKFKTGYNSNYGYHRCYWTSNSSYNTVFDSPYRIISYEIIPVSSSTSDGYKFSNVHKQSKSLSGLTNSMGRIRPICK